MTTISTKNNNKIINDYNYDIDSTDFSKLYIKIFNNVNSDISIMINFLDGSVIVKKVSSLYNKLTKIDKLIILKILIFENKGIPIYKQQLEEISNNEFICIITKFDYSIIFSELNYEIVTVKYKNETHDVYVIPNACNEYQDFECSKYATMLEIALYDFVYLDPEVLDINKYNFWKERFRIVCNEIEYRNIWNNIDRHNIIIPSNRFDEIMLFNRYLVRTQICEKFLLEPSDILLELYRDGSWSVSENIENENKQLCIYQHKIYLEMASNICNLFNTYDLSYSLYILNLSTSYLYMSDLLKWNNCLIPDTRDDMFLDIIDLPLILQKKNSSDNIMIIATRTIKSK
jgi:hypothetical protein